MNNGVNRSDGVNWSYGVNESYGVINSYGIDKEIFCSNKKRVFKIFGIEDFQKLRAKIGYFFEGSSGLLKQMTGEEYFNRLSLDKLIQFTDAIKEHGDVAIITLANFVKDRIKSDEGSIKTKEFEIEELKKGIKEKKENLKKIQKFDNLEEALIELLK